MSNSIFNKVFTVESILGVVFINEVDQKEL